MLYYIMNKDNKLASFEWKELADNNTVAVNFKQIDNIPDFILKDINDWIESRTPPKHREHMICLLKAMNLSNSKSVIDYSKGLSLTDTLWITNDTSIRWKDVSLYKNPFDEVIANIAFDGGLRGIRFSTTSPEFATDGMLPKCWVRDKGKITLKKGGTSGFANTGNEPYSEVLASQLLDVLEYEHIRYTLETYRGKLVSSCDLMTNEEISLMPLYKLVYVNNFNDIIEYAKSINSIKELYQMVIFDYLSLNTDRHLGNIGVLVNSDTFKPIKLAPIYDNGASMLNYYMVGDSLEDFVARNIPNLYNSFSILAIKAKEKVGNSNIEKALNIKFNRKEVKGYSDDKIDIIEEFVTNRANKFLTW